MADLKLIALDDEDLAVLSAHLQDAVVRVGDILYEAPVKRFAMVVNRFDWSSLAGPGRDNSFTRRRTGIRLQQVTAVRSRNINRSDTDAVLSLLAIIFAPTELPSGIVTLHFSGSMAIELDVECIEAELRDLGAAWTTARQPRHPGIHS